MTNWNKEQTTLLLSLYEEHPCLFNITDPGYQNRNLREKQILRICEELKEIKPNVTPSDIKLKIRNIRSKYSREKKKNQESKRSGAGTREVYEPKLWCYELVSFLDGSSESGEASSNINSNKIFSKVDAGEREVPNIGGNKSGSTFQNTTIKKTSFRKEATNAFNTAKGLAENITQQRAARLPQTKEEIFCYYLCAELKKIQLEDNYGEVTWKILETVRDAVKKDKADRNNNVAVAGNSPFLKTFRDALKKDAADQNKVVPVAGSSSFNSLNEYEESSPKKMVGNKVEILRVDVLRNTFSTPDLCNTTTWSDCDVEYTSTPTKDSSYIPHEVEYLQSEMDHVFDENANFG